MWKHQEDCVVCADLSSAIRTDLNEDLVGDLSGMGLGGGGSLDCDWIRCHFQRCHDNHTQWWFSYL